MQISTTISTPFQIIKAVEKLTETEKETLAIMADEKLSEELMKRRRHGNYRNEERRAYLGK